MRKTIYKTVLYAVKLKKMYDRYHIAAYSAGAAFFMLVSAVPLVMFGISVMEIITPADTTAVGRLTARFFTDNVSGYILRIVAEIKNYSTVPFVSVTMIFLLVAATRGIRSIGQGIGVIYGTDGRYNIVQFTARSVVYTFVMTAVCIVSVAVFVSVQWLYPDGQSAGAVFFLGIARGLMLFAVLVLLSVFAYHIFGGGGTKFAKHCPGAMVTAAGWMIYSFGYSVYIRHFSRYSILYGSFGAVMLFMLWLYMCMNILLCGALINRLKFCDKM